MSPCPPAGESGGESRVGTILGVELTSLGEVAGEIDVAASVLHNLTTGEEWRLKPLGEVAPILEAGGVFPYARKVGMLK